MSEYVCSNCGSDRIGATQRGIDNWLVAQCYDCGPGSRSGIPEEDGTEKTRLKRAKAIKAATVRPVGSKKALHTVLRPVVLRGDYRPKAKPEVAPSVGMFD